MRIFNQFIRAYFFFVGRSACGCRSRVGSLGVWVAGHETPEGSGVVALHQGAPCQVAVSVLAASRLPLQLGLFGTPFLWPFAVVSPLTVFGANSKLSSITLLSGLLNAPPHPAPQIRRVSPTLSPTLCALQIYLGAYLLKLELLKF